MEVQQAILTKRAVRKFKQQTLNEKEITAILNAGRRAQSSKNSQQWHFIAVTSQEKLKQMVVLGQFASPLQGAAFAVCILTPDPNQRWSIMFDAGQAAAYMQLAAWEMGIGSVPIAIYKPEDARAMFGFPNDLHMNAALAFGYPEDQTVFVRPPKGHAGRKPGKEIFHWEQW